MSVHGLRCILYARIYIPYVHTILYYYVPVSYTHLTLPTTPYV